MAELQVATNTLEKYPKIILAASYSIYLCKLLGVYADWLTYDLSMMARANSNCGLRSGSGHYMLTCQINYIYYWQKLA